MSYLALYRKYRPNEFDEIVGQENIIKVLKNSILNNKFSHAYLFSGPRGTGKTSMAKLIAKLINCENSNNGHCCDKCPSCVAFNLKNNSDIVEIDAASNNGVDEIREIRDKASLMPALSKYKVYIIDEVHMLSTGAFNALLKTIEEPPEHVIFILATTEFYKVPETIISRCQCFDFERISETNIINRLKYICSQENIEIDNEVLELIAKYSDGAMRDAISMLDKLVCCNDKITAQDYYDLKGLTDPKDIEEIVKELYKNDYGKFLDILDKLTNKGKNIILLSEEIMNEFKSQLIMSVKNEVKLDVEEDQLYQAIDNLGTTIDKMKQSNYPKTLLEICLIKMGKIFQANSKIISREIIGSEKCSDNTINIIKDVNIEITPEIDEKINEESLKEEQDIDQNKTIQSISNKNIRINNALALANKSLLEDLKIKWINFSNYLNNKEFSGVVSYFIDGNLRVAGDKDIIISLKYASILQNADLNIKKIEELFKLVSGNYYKIAFILDEDWDKIKQKYITDKNNGIKYEYKEETEEEIIEIKPKKKEKASEIVNDAISIFGSDIVEIK